MPCSPELWLDEDDEVLDDPDGIGAGLFVPDVFFDADPALRCDEREPFDALDDLVACVDATAAALPVVELPAFEFPVLELPIFELDELDDWTAEVP